MVWMRELLTSYMQCFDSVSFISKAMNIFLKWITEYDLSQIRVIFKLNFGVFFELM